MRCIHMSKTWRYHKGELMGGLLDKATKSQEETTVEPVKSSETKTGQNKSDASKIVADVIPSKAAPAPISEGPDYLIIGTGVLLLVGLILSLWWLVPKVVTCYPAWISNHFLFGPNER